MERSYRRTVAKPSVLPVSRYSRLSRIAGGMHFVTLLELKKTCRPIIVMRFM